MLTGDKVETARTIGFSCKLLEEDMKLYEVIQSDPPSITRILDSAMTDIKRAKDLFVNQKRAIVVSGDALTPIMASQELSKKVASVDHS